MNDNTFEVTDLRQWAYCPRVVYYQYCLPDIRPMTKLMLAGMEEHRSEVGREERRSLRTYGLKQGERFFDVPLRSETLGLRGRVDLVIAIPDRQRATEVIVVEYKSTEGKAGPHVKLQLCAYALMIEETWRIPVKRGFIYHMPERKAEAITISASLRDRVRATIEAMRVTVDCERMPAPPASRAQCTVCEFRRFCNDVV
ncbi:CRISPR-associated protein Cas4 [Roseiflexus sp.]|uniref:CRISPR-associated protein Cas4 n=1 Tax=Roseiflexus sp. TaxID=2562120 RepID=UPI00398B1DDB